MIYLGFDISTTCIGTCIYMDDGSKYGKVLKLGSFPLTDKKLQKDEAIYIKKKRFIEEVVIPYKETYKKFDKIVIEEPLLRSNNVNTVAVLLKFNGMISDAVYNIFGIVPEFISSHDARAFSFPQLMAIRKFDKKGNQYDSKKVEGALKKGSLVLFGDYPWDVDKKEVMMEMVNETFDGMSWEYSSKGTIKKENYDANDALIVCLGQRNKLKYNGELPQLQYIKTEKEKDKSIYHYTTKVGDDVFEKTIELSKD